MEGPQSVNIAARSQVPAPRGAGSAGSEIVIRTMTTDLESLARGGGLARPEAVAMRAPAPRTREAYVPPPPSPPQISRGNLGRQAPVVPLPASVRPSVPTEAGPKSDLGVWILIVLAGIGFLALVAYALYRLMGY